MNLKSGSWLLLTAVFCLVFPSAVFSQNAVGDVSARLSLVDGKTVYRMGEPVRLTLTFAASGGEYNVLINSGWLESASDKIFLSPKDGAFDWIGEYARVNRTMRDSFTYTKLSDQPLDVEIVLNHTLRFDRPGKYSARIETKRVETGDLGGKNRTRISLTMNEVGFEIKEMSETEEEQEIKRLSALLDVKLDWEKENKISEQLSFLAGDASTGEKVRRYLDSSERSGNYHHNFYFGLFFARNRTLAVKLLETVLRDPNRAANFQLLNMLVQLRLLQENAKSRTDVPETFERKEIRADEIRQIYLQEIIESLPKRAGKNRTTTAIAILQSLPRENTPPDALGKVREILLKEFDNLDILEREYLLSAYWDKLRDSSLAPSIERMLTDKNLPQIYSHNVRTTALKRLMELDKSKARPFVVAEISNPTSLVDVEVLKLLDDKFLPETDDALLEQIRDLAQLKTKNRDYVLLRQKTLLAARYATAKIYDGLMKTYATHCDQWFADAKASLLGYFARHNDKEAVALIEEALAKLGTGSEFSFLLDLTKMNYSPGVDALLRKRLAADDSQAASNAAYLMSKYGTEANKKLIQARYDRWLKEWSGRNAELDAEETDAKLGYQAGFQINMIEALIRAEAWQLPAAEVQRLKQSCIAEKCRQHFRIR